MARVIEPHPVLLPVDTPPGHKARRGLHPLHLARQPVFKAVAADAPRSRCRTSPHRAVGVEKQHFVIAPPQVGFFTTIRPSAPMDRCRSHSVLAMSGQRSSDTRSCRSSMTIKSLPAPFIFQNSTVSPPFRLLRAKHPPCPRAINARRRSIQQLLCSYCTISPPLSQ